MKTKRVHFQINKNAAYLPLQAILLFFFTAILLELGARTDFVQSKVPFQALGTDNIEFEAKFDNINAVIERDGPIDCLFIGNSTVGRGMDPIIFNAAYQVASGEEIRCFNFSVNGTNIPSSIMIIKILVKHYHPKLVILGTSTGEYAAGFHDVPQERYVDNPWFKYQLGEFSPIGWLTDNSFAYRMLLLFSYSANHGLNLQPTYDKVPPNNKNRDNYGFGYTAEVKTDINTPTKADRERFYHIFGGLIASRNIAASLEDLFQFQQQAGFQIVLVEMPYHKSLITLYDTPGKFEEKREDLAEFYYSIREQLLDAANRHNVLFLRTTHLFMIPDNGWKDREHLNGPGAAIFSQWLGSQLGTALSSGAISNSTNGK